MQQRVRRMFERCWRCRPTSVTGKHYGYTLPYSTCGATDCGSILRANEVMIDTFMAQLQLPLRVVILGHIRSRRVCTIKLPWFLQPTEELCCAA